jgi:plastocyanin
MRQPIILFIEIFLLFCVNHLVFAGDISGKVTAKGARHAGNAVIYIEKTQGVEFAPPEKHAVVDQKDLTFIPHVLPVLVGTTVDFHNSDDVLHNVFTPDKCAEKFNLGTWPKGETRSYTFKEPGCISVMLCNVHPEMEAFILALETPYFAMSDEEGSYVIKNVPPGKYTLNIWHERLKGEALEITVPKEGAVTQNFLIKK